MSAPDVECICPMTDPSMWTTYGGATEPGSTMEWDPDCPVHPSATRAPLPLQVETSCPTCNERVTVLLVSASATAEVQAVRFAPEYVAHHRCPIHLPGDPWDVPVPAPPAEEDPEGSR